MKIKKVNCLIDFFSEEIPASMQLFLEKELNFLFEKMFNKTLLKYKNIEILSSPRHHCVVISDIDNVQKNQTIDIKGPRIDAPKLAVEGFLKTNKITLKNLTINKTNKGEFFFYKKFIKGKNFSQLITDIIQEVCSSISWPKSQRWGNSDLKWGRPLRNIMVLIDGSCINGKIKINDNEFLKFKNYTYAHRSIKKPLKIKALKDFVNVMKNSFVLVNRLHRKNSIEKQISKITRKLKLNYHKDESLLNEVTGLVEFPNVLVGKIDKQYMKLPFEILSTVMKVHQKYFSLLDNSMKIAPYFLVVSNLKPNNLTDKNVINGNERVLKARLSDALFFWENDCKKDFSFYIKKLKTMIFYEGLGDLYERSLRLSNINKKIGILFNIKDTNKLKKLGLYSKLDLSSNLVGEFPELQGVMLKYLAKTNGLSKDMQVAFEDQYKPIGLNKDLPRNKLGSILSISNNIDTLSSFFSLGLMPTGSRDPFALRRSGNSLINVLWFERNTLSLEKLMRLLDERFNNNIKLLDELKKFLIDRLYNFLLEKGFKSDRLSAIILKDNIDTKTFLEIKNELKALDKILNSRSGVKFISNFKRIYNITKKSENLSNSFKIREDLFIFRDEEKLYKFLKKLSKNNKITSELNYNKLQLEHFKEFNLLIEDFFDNVLVNDKNNKLKKNRIQLLEGIKFNFNKICKFELIKT